MSERRCDCGGSLVWVGSRYMCADCGRTSNPHIAAARAKVEGILHAFGEVDSKVNHAVSFDLTRRLQEAVLLFARMRELAMAALKELEQCQ